MNATVFWEGGGIWHVLASPTMRSLGEVIRQPDGSLVVDPDTGSDIAGMTRGPYADLDAAMDAIGAHLGGACTTQRRGGARAK
jgi:hypothetical protein